MLPEASRASRSVSLVRRAWVVGRSRRCTKGDASPAELSEAASAVGENLRLFLNVAVEAYPQLNATQNFQRLQDELAETENRINVARRDYNESVQTYNTYIRQFPQVVTAKVIGAERREPFEAPEAAQPSSASLHPSQCRSPRRCCCSAAASQRDWRPASALAGA